MSGPPPAIDTAPTTGMLVPVGDSGQVMLIPQGANTPPGAGGSGEIRLGKLLEILRRRRRLLLAVFAATVAVGATLTLHQRLFSPVYQGGFRLLVIDPINPSDSSGPDTGILKDLALQPQGETNTPDLIAVLTSPLLLQPIAQRLNVSQDQIASALSISNSSRETTGVLDVSLRWNDPLEGKQILEAISADYLAFSLRQRQEKLAQGLSYLDAQAPALQQRVVKLQEQLSRFRSQNSFLEPVKQGEANLAQRQALQGRLDQLRQSEAQLLGLASAVRAGKLAGPSFQGAENTKLADGNQPELAGGAFSKLLQDLTELEKQLAEAEASFSSSSPQVQSLRARVNQMRPLLQQRELDAIQAALAENRSEQAEVDRQSLQMSRKFATNPNLIKEYDAIQQRLDIARENVTSYLKTREEFRLEEAQRTRPWRVIAPADFGDRPVQPNLRRNLLLSILLGGLAGVGAALLRDHFDDVFHRPREVEEELGLPLLGGLPFLPMEGGLTMAQVVAGLEPEARLGLKESFQNLFTNVRLLRADKAVRLIALTSAVEEEGKSTATALLAQTLADLGQRVLLVDADMRQPSLHRQMGVETGAGFSTLLADPTLVAERVIQPISATLDLITAGTTPQDATKLLSSERCSVVLEQIRALPGYDVVLFDTPPSLNLSDSLLLSEQLDAVLFLVSLQRVDRALPSLALRRFRSSGVDVLGLITNQVTKGSGSYEGLYGYVHGYRPNSEVDAAGSKATSKGAKAKGGASKLMRWLDERD